jgi:hypothetical protein
MNVPLPPDRRDEVRKQTSNIGISIGSERTPTASSLTLLPVLVETWISVAVVLLAISARLFCLLGGCDDAIVSCGFGGSAGCTINR